MGNILDQIVADKRIEVAEKKGNTKYDSLEAMPFFNRPTLSARDFVLKPEYAGIIAEIKRKSPSKGVFKQEVDVPGLAKAYYDAGASCNSILTDSKYFMGYAEDIIEARPQTDIPILRKDFIVDEFQIVEAKAIGADMILLIASVLSPAEIKHFSKLAKSLDLSILLEVHDEEELYRSVIDEIDLVGVNNRNLKTFEVSIDTSLGIVDKIPDEFVKISESGISNPDTIVTLKEAGFDGFLIGECFMTEEDPGAACKKFIDQVLSKV